MPQSRLHVRPQNAIRAVNNLRGRECIITFHSLGDLDACASALSLCEELGIKAVVASPDRINSESKRILGNLANNIQLFENARGSMKNAPIVLLDSSDPSLLKHLKGEKIFLLIDHHAKSAKSLKAGVEWVEPDASSTCELMASIIDEPTYLQARLLVLGIISDSAHLVRADKETFAALSHLLEFSDSTYEELLAQINLPESVGSRAGVLEGIRQAVWAKKGDLLIATAAVSSHESHVAEVLVSAGADAAFAGTANAKGDARISARIRPSLSDKIDLPKLMEEVGKKIGGHGGGHPAAAGASGPDGSDVPDALQMCQKLFFSRIGKE